MSIALKRSNNSNEFMHHGICLPIYRTKEEDKDERLEDGVGGEEGEENSWCSSSSIGKNSDVLSEEEDGSEEVQSSYKGGEEEETSFGCLDALEEGLPIRRGISKFYNGKSKSFASLTEASAVSTIKEVAKPDNAYARKRRNILASSNHVWNKNFKSNGGGISKRQGSFPLSRSTLALAVAMNSSSSDSNVSSEDSVSGSPPTQLPPLPPGGRQPYSSLSAAPERSFLPWRSYSVADLQRCASVGSVCYSSVSDVTEES